MITFVPVTGELVRVVDGAFLPGGGVAEAEGWLSATGTPWPVPSDGVRGDGEGADAVRIPPDNGGRGGPEVPGRCIHAWARTFFREISTC